MRESRIEKVLKDSIDNRLNGLCLKFNSGISGMPDRIVIVNNKIIFVELKAPGKKPRPLQVYMHSKLRELGQTVLVLDSVEKVRKFVKELEDEIYTT
mgnify:CR=1 FL=1